MAYFHFSLPGLEVTFALHLTLIWHTVITKDLSRLGRDYIQTGYYIDIYFKEHNVRYIAMNDNIDTKQDDNDIAPFKNILNDM